MEFWILTACMLSSVSLIGFTVVGFGLLMDKIETNSKHRTLS